MYPALLSRPPLYPRVYCRSWDGPGSSKNLPVVNGASFTVPPLMGGLERDQPWIDRDDFLIIAMFM